MNINERIAALRAAMSTAGLAAYIIPSSDAHLSEYTPEHWKSRRWISGFTGSAGSVVITANKAGLWTDSRYYLQGAEQIAGTEIQLYKDGLSETPSIENFLAHELPSGSVVGFDGRCFAHADAATLIQGLCNHGIEVNVDHDLFTCNVWRDRPAIPDNKFFLQPVEYCGECVSDKLVRLRKTLAEKGADAYIVTMLDELAWIFNIRGNDVECNPVGVGYGFISDKQAILFADTAKLDKESAAALGAQGVSLLPYEEAYSFVAALPGSTTVFIDSKRINEAFSRALPAECKRIQGVSAITMMKAVKNETELAGVRRSMLRDGVALTRFFIRLEKDLAIGKTPDEVEIGELLKSYRAAQERYFGDSFETIAGYQGHGAIVHYKAEKETAYKLRPEGILLLDSGGQYYDGTTDITRTISLDGNPGDEVRRDYTLVMKGHIAVALAQYIEGTRGSQIDILARKPLWDEGFSYGHGTGHGVGCFLNVHEGPQNIRTDENPTSLEIGMITSNEPGIYRADRWGIRIENLVVTKLNVQTEFGRFLGFETLTLCYFDNTMLIPEMLTEVERKWYNDYQARVYRELSPLLTDEESAWLREKTVAI